MGDDDVHARPCVVCEILGSASANLVELCAQSLSARVMESVVCRIRGRGVTTLHENDKPELGTPTQLVALWQTSDGEARAPETRPGR